MLYENSETRCRERASEKNTYPLCRGKRDPSEFYKTIWGEAAQPEQN